MKKTTISIGASFLCILYGVLSWGIVTHSEPPGPEDSEFAQICSYQINSQGVADTGYNECCVDYHEALAAAKRDWQNHLKSLMAQEIPASDMVAGAYESLRTYNCWTEYICRAVQYSSYAPLESGLTTGLRSQHLGTVPGCQDPENLRMEGEYNAFVSTLKEVPLLSVPVKAGESAVNAFENIAVENKINYFPRCMTDRQNNNKNPSVEQVQANYEGCKNVLALDFNCPEGVDEVFCEDTSNALVTVESALKAKNAEQKAGALERKLAQILPKMHAMEEHANYLLNFLKQLDSRFGCYAAKCR